MVDPEKSLAFALDKYPDRVELLPVRRLVLEAARQNPKRPAYLKIAVPDEMVKTVRGKEEDADLVLLVRVPREVLRRENSPIILPSEAR